MSEENQAQQGDVTEAGVPLKIKNRKLRVCGYLRASRG